MSPLQVVDLVANYQKRTARNRGRGGLNRAWLDLREGVLRPLLGV